MSDSKKPEKSFDCVEFKRQAQLRIYERIKNMSPAEEIEYFRRQAESGPFADLIARIPREPRVVGTHSPPVRSA
jgi:hypothetical protein